MTTDPQSRRVKLESRFGKPWYGGMLIAAVILLLAMLNSYLAVEEHIFGLFLPRLVGFALWGVGTLLIVIGLVIQNKRFELGAILITIGAVFWLFSPKPVYIEAFILVCYEARKISNKADRLRKLWAVLLSIGSCIGYYVVTVIPQYRYTRSANLYPDLQTWLADPLNVLVLTLGPVLVCISIGFFWQLGLSSRRQLLKLRALEDKAELAAVRERNRIAREMHDIIAHSLTVMIAQADGGKFAGKKNPDMALQALETIGEVGRKALGETRQLLSVLHENSQPERELGTTPGVDGIEDLVRETRRAGAEVTYRVAGRPIAVSESIGLNIFRIVQESFTNALKHAGPRPITAEVYWDETEPSVHIRIENELGLGLISETGGHGLVGIAERVRIHGGTASWGKLENAGKWYVDVHLPL